MQTRKNSRLREHDHHISASTKNRAPPTAKGAQSILDCADVPLDAIHESTEVLELHFRGCKGRSRLSFFWMARAREAIWKLVNEAATAVRPVIVIRYLVRKKSATPDRRCEIIAALLFLQAL
jgi:hypothetical protein